MLERASIAGGATIAVFLVVILCMVVYINYKRKAKALEQQTSSSDCVDGGPSPLRRPPMFGTRWRTEPPPPGDVPVGVHKLTLLVPKD